MVYAARYSNAIKLIRFFKAYCDSPKLLQLLKRAFNDIAFPIKMFVVRSRTDPIASCRDDRKKSSPFDRVHQK